MKVFLMYPDRDVSPQRELRDYEETLVQDLELNILFEGIAEGDKFLFKVARQTIFSGLDEPDTICYRQDVLKDCLKHPDVVREMYRVSVQSMENKRRHWLGIFNRYPGGILSGAVNMLEMFVEPLKALKEIADKNAEQFKSKGFRRFFSMIREELDEGYFAVVEKHLKELKFHSGVLVSAGLGKGNEGTNYILRKINHKSHKWVRRVFTRKSPVYSYTIPRRDGHGAQALGELRDRGINLIANAVAQSADHIDSFFKALRVELAFYIGCLNLSARLGRLGEPITFPRPVPVTERRHSFAGLYDIALALTMDQKVVGNDVAADGKNLVVITGANQGGKSTFLRSVGLAQLMMQCGMFVPAESFSANLCTGLFTHYKREEDTSMESGKFDEELTRMSGIIDAVSPGAIILFNESFASTNEREGSEIARQITHGLLERNIKMFFVTHLFEFPQSFYEKHMENVVFLRAERQVDGKRTFRLVEGGPLQTSYGEDVFNKIFGISS